MKSNIFSLFAGILLPFCAVSQVCNEDLCIPRETIIKTSLTGPIQHAAYTALAVEVPVWKQIAVQGEAMYTYKYIFRKERLATSPISGGLKLDVKYYLPKSTSLRLYTGPGISYHIINTKWGQYAYKPGTDENGDTIDLPYVDMTGASAIRTTNTDILWQVGIQPYLVKHVALSVYTGAGIGFQQIKVVSGSEPTDLGDKNFVYFSKIFGVQIGIAF